jgi:TMEM189-like protein
MKAIASDLPAHDIVDGWTRRIEICALIAAGTLLLANIDRIVVTGLWWHWCSPLLLLAAALAADLISGLVHWIADTWFSETMPFLGRRFLRPFRVHHVNPEDFLRRDAIDCNGDVAMLNVPILLVALLLPETGPGGAVSLHSLHLPRSPFPPTRCISGHICRHRHRSFAGCSAAASSSVSRRTPSIIAIHTSPTTASRLAGAIAC